MKNFTTTTNNGSITNDNGTTTINNIAIINDEFFFKDSKGGFHDLWEDMEKNITTVELDNGEVWYCHTDVLTIDGENKIVYVPFEESPVLP